MADSMATFNAYTAQFEIPYMENNEMDNMLNTPDPGLPFSEEQLSGVVDVDRYIYDPTFEVCLDELGINGPEAGPSSLFFVPMPESVNCGNNAQCPESGSRGNKRSIQAWPVPPVPYLCSCCLVLREIIHTSGTNHDMTKLEIHGRLGLICHAVLEIRQSTSENQYQMFDFCDKSMEDVKNFLVEYCNERKQSGYLMLPDPLSIFYDALFVGLDRHSSSTPANPNMQPPMTNPDDYTAQPPPMTNSGNYYSQPQMPNSDDHNAQPAMMVNTTDDCNIQQPLANPGASDINHQQPVLVNNEINHQQAIVVNDPRRIPRTPLARQRMRTGTLTVRDFAHVFHLPIEAAAKEMSLCPTVVKRICREGGLNRWPHRKIKSIRRKVKKLTPKLDSDDAEERLSAQAQMEKLRDEWSEACAGIIPPQLSGF